MFTCSVEENGIWEEVQFSVLFNGSPADFFGSSEGIETRGPAISHVVSGYDGDLQ